jgi:hypothetical protein
MAEDDQNNAGTAVILGVLVVIVMIVVSKAVNGQKALVMNCMPIMGNEVQGRVPSSSGTSNTSGEGFAPVTPYFDVDTMKPKTKATDPEWAKKYATATDDLLGQNYVDNADPRKYSMTKSTCGRRFMSLDLRRVPVPTRDPTTVTSFGLPYIPPECVRYWEDTRPSLDC